MNLLSIYTGYALDLIIGDPYSFPHPVRYIGKLISMVEKQIRKIISSDKGLKIAGFFLWFIVVGLTFCVTSLILQLFKFNKIIYFVVNTILIYTTLATKCLKDEAKKIYDVLKTGDIKKSRIQLSYIVGRDTENLSEKEIIRATVETVAENTVDGLIAPLFYAFVGACINVGGISLAAPLAMTYKAINTLDSSVGYKNEKYLHIGFASAKIDDIANYIPSRISVILFTIGNLFLRNDYKNCFSPNCAFSEGAVAGALGIQLGGTNIYFGETVYKPTIGDKTREIEVQDISRTNKILYATSLTSMLVFTLFYVIIHHIFM